MTIFKQIAAEITAIQDKLVTANHLPEAADLSRMVVELPRDMSHGDLATNVAMVTAKIAKMKPRDLAELYATELRQLDVISDVEIAGPGFINLRLADGIWPDQLRQIHQEGEAYGKSQLGANQKVNVEFVSANPTGPLHAAHARGAIFGDSLAHLLEFAGFDVVREYYINDAGTQVDVLAQSAYLRYREAFGEEVEIPAGLYPGDYLKDVGEALKSEYGDQFLDQEESEIRPIIRDFAIHAIMAGIKADLARLGVSMDLYSSERALTTNGKVDEALQSLTDQGLVYRGVLEPPKGQKPDDWEEREQLLFRATDFGDDVDRPLQKSDGTWTYFASDIAYHYDKYQRLITDHAPENCKMIDVWGADHGGYVKRMTAAVKALSGEDKKLDVKLCQLVSLLENGQPVKMSKRAGTFVTLSDVMDAVGADVMRFIMLTRRNDQTLEFDYAKVTEKSRENPVFYVQYAHARARSVFRQDGAISDFDDADLSLLSDELELKLIKQLVSWPSLVESAAQSHEPHRVAFYLMDLAAAFHSLWNGGRDNHKLKFIQDDDVAMTKSRLYLVNAVSIVIRSGLKLLSINAAEEM
ncbi:MAG: arginine--tRNA ligase [Candidatus Puniceispirillaceae bacterium]